MLASRNALRRLQKHFGTFNLISAIKGYSQSIFIKKRFALSLLILHSLCRQDGVGKRYILRNLQNSSGSKDLYLARSPILLRIARNLELGRLGSKYLFFSFTASLSSPKVVCIKRTPYQQLRAVKLTALRVLISVLLRGSGGVLYISRRGSGFFRAQTRRRHPITSWIGLQWAS